MQNFQYNFASISNNFSSNYAFQRFFPYVADGKYTGVSRSSRLFFALFFMQRGEAVLRNTCGKRIQMNKFKVVSEKNGTFNCK